MDQLWRLTILASSANVTAKSVAAEQMYPIITPQITSIDIFLTRPAIKRTNPIDIMAPAKAASIMNAELTAIPFPRRTIIRSDTTSFAPEEIPMTKEEFQKLTQNVVLLDGATGSNLMAAGMPRGICTEAWIMEHKEVLQKLQKAYVEAGSQIVYAPTFGGNRYSLGLHGLQDKLAEMNHALVNISREAVGHKVYVAGDITTTGKMMEPAGDLTYEMAYETYCEQIKVLEDAGVDLIAAETMINIEETLAALDAAASVSSLPVMCTMTVEADGSIFSGGNAVEAAIALEGAGAVAVGINCSVGPDQLVSVVRNIKENVSIPVIAKPNAGMPTIDDQGNAIYSMDAKSFAEHMKVLIENGASVVGGCCGTTPEFIREISRSLGR